ncbi:HpcH/HpaI aldolase family protein [Jatrophihabitans sp. DSM 45814]
MTTDRKEPLRERLERRGILMGMQNFTGNPALVEILGASGFDFVSLDMEHAPTSWREVEEMARAADVHGFTALARVSTNDPIEIMKALDRGVDGVIVPHIGTPEDLQRAVAAAHYPPSGVRGACSAVRATQYSVSKWSEYYQRADAETMVVPLLEDARALDNLDELMAADDVWLYFLGVRDLAQDLGVPGADYRHPVLADAVERVLRASADAGKSVIAPVAPNLEIEYATYLLELGFKCLSFGTDVSFFARSCADVLSGVERFRRPVSA